MKLKIVPMNIVSTSEVAEYKSARKARLREIERELRTWPNSKLAKRLAKFLEEAEHSIHELKE